MKNRPLGRTGLKVSELGFGCGAVGGLMVRGEPAEQRRALERAVELGINYFDTAAFYGNGQSETNLGRVLREVRADVLVGTKCRPSPESVGRMGEAVMASIEASLRRLQLERVDLIQLHNALAPTRAADRDALRVEDALAEAVPALQRAVAQGKARFWGINGLGDTASVIKAIDKAGAFTTQACYNLLEPTGSHATPKGFPFQDYGRLIERAARQKMGVIGIRVMAGGALSGTLERHPIADQSVSPIATGKDYASDVQMARRFEFLVRDGYVSELPEAALRFAISNQNISTALVGFSSIEQLEKAASYVEKGPLPAEALKKLEDVWEGMGGATH